MKVSWSIFAFFLLLYSVSAKVSENNLQDDYSDYNEEIYRKYVQMDKQLKSIAEKSVKQLLPYLLEAREHVNISSSCARNLFDLITGFRKLTEWSFNFLDAMGKLQSGIKTGNFYMFGEYEECIETKVIKKGKIDYQGQYCGLSCKPLLPKVKKIPTFYGRLEGLVNATRNTSGFMKYFISQIQAFYTFNVKIGLCVPSGCTKQDVEEIVKYSIQDYINCEVKICLKEGDVYYWTRRRTIIACVFVLIGVIVLVSTCCDNMLESWKNNKLGFKSRILQCFSLTRNFPKLMSTDESENSIQCVNGIRVLTMFWVVLGHDYFFRGIDFMSNHTVPTIENMLKGFFSQIAWNAFMCVEIFFFMSGFLNAYIRIRMEHHRKSPPGFLKMIVHRLWRIYPAYFVSFPLMYLLTKPQPFTYEIPKRLLDICDWKWWQNIIFINNLFDPEKMCMPQSWFLCVDMQLFLLTLFTIPILARNPKKGVILHVAIIVIVNLCCMTWWFTDDIAPGTVDATSLNEKERMKSFHIYTLPPVHVGPYVVGILLGYILATKRDMKIPKISQLFGWFSASLLFISMLFMTLIWNSGNPYTQLTAALYGAWSKTLFALGFSWLVLCCATGHGGVINYILSLKMWIPLSRLTYMLFLVSPILQAHYYTHRRFPDTLDDMDVIWIHFANIFISILLGFALILLTESPMIAMEKVLFQRKQDTSNKTPESPKEMVPNELKENGIQENGTVTTIHL